MLAEVVAVKAAPVVLAEEVVLEVLAVTETTLNIVVDIVVLFIVQVITATSTKVGIVPELMVDKVDMVDTIKVSINLLLQIIVITFVCTV